MTTEELVVEEKQCPKIQNLDLKKQIFMCTLRDITNWLQVKLWRELILQGKEEFYLIEWTFFYF